MSTLDRIALGRMAKTANQRMRRLEKAGFERSPMYKSQQAFLAQLGIAPTASGARRFPENFRNVPDELLIPYENKLQDMATPDPDTGINLATVQGVKQFYDLVYEGANRRYKLSEKGIGRKAWGDMWSAMSDKTKDRVYGSEVYVRIIKAYYSKYKDPSERMTDKEIAQTINAHSNFMQALKSVGLSMHDYVQIGKEERGESDTEHDQA